MSSAASQASSALATTRPSGTGTPQLASSDLVRSLSLAMLSPMALVWSVSAVQMRRWRGAVAELHQVAVVQADVRDAAVGGGVDDAARCSGRGSSRSTMASTASTDALAGDVEGLVVDRRHQQVAWPSASATRPTCSSRARNTML